MRKIQYTVAATLITLVSVAHAASGSDMTSTIDSDASFNDSSVSIEVKSAPRLVSATKTDVTLEWDKVGAASGYIVRYGQESLANNTDTSIDYPGETDILTTTGTLIGSLTGSVYYFTLVATDAKGNESKTFSDELKVVMGDTSSSSGSVVSDSGTTDPVMNSAPSADVGFAVKSASGVEDDSGTVIVEFSNALSDTPVSLKIAKTSDNTDIAVTSAMKDPTNPKRVIVKVATPLISLTSYSITVVTASDTSGKNIEEGVKGMVDFSSPTYIMKKIELPKTLSTTGATSTGNVKSDEPIKRANDLPATGPKENIIVILALMLGFGIVTVIRKRSA